MGGRNVIDAAIKIRGCASVLALSTDKAVNPVNCCGDLKLVAEKLFVQANAYSGNGPTRFSCVRYGNVAGSRGSVIPLFLAQRKKGKITVTDPAMTRFWLTLEQGVLRAFRRELASRQDAIGRAARYFVPKIPEHDACSTLAETIAPGCEIETIGIQARERSCTKC